MRLGVFLSHFPIYNLIYLIDMLNNLANEGLEIDLYLQNAGNKIPVFHDNIKPVILPEVYTSQIKDYIGSPFSLIPADNLGIIFANLKKNDYDYCIGIESIGLVMAKKVAEILNCPLGYLSFELYDKTNPGVWGDELDILKKFEAQTVPGLDLLLIQDKYREEALYRILNVSTRPKKVIHFPVSLSPMRSFEKQNYWRETYGLPANSKIALYFGQLSKNRFIDQMVIAFQQIRSDIFLVVKAITFGNNQYLEYLKSLDHNNKVIFDTHEVSWHERWKLISSADVGIVFYRNNVINDYLTGKSSDKMASYMQCGIPVVCPDFPTFSEVIDQYRNGVCVNNLSELPKALGKIFNGYNIYKHGAEKAFKEVYDITIYTRQLINHIRKNITSKQKISSDYDRLYGGLNLVNEAAINGEEEKAVILFKQLLIEFPYDVSILNIYRNNDYYLTWKDLKNLSSVRLYAGDIPNREEYKNLVGLSIDKKDYRHIEHDITKLFPLKNNSVDSFQAEDVLEHISYEKVSSVINEIYRILKPGATFRLSIPDYGCDILYERSIKDENGRIIFDAGGGGTIDNPGHLWYPVITNVRQLLQKTEFAKSGTIEFIQYYNLDGTFVLKNIDYSKGFVMRNPDHDERVQNPRRPMSLIVDLVKSEDEYLNKNGTIYPNTQNLKNEKFQQDKSCDSFNDNIPVILICYNRPWHTQQVLDSLKNHGINNLYIFSDAPKSENDINGVAQTRELIKSINWTKPEVVLQTENQGLAKSINNAVETVFNKYDKLILLEDDCVPQEYFFDFMNSCLNKYENNERIFGISGYTVPISNEILNDYHNDVYFFPRIGSWGWGTWKRAWNKKINDLNYLKEEVIKNKIDIDQGGNDVKLMFEQLLNGSLKDVWTINWLISVYLNKGYYIYPVKSHIINIGMDGSGVHCGATKKYETVISDSKPFRFPDEIVIDNSIKQNFRKYYDIGNKTTYKSILKKKELKVVHLCTLDFGGAGRAAYRLHKGLQMIGVDSTFIVLDKRSGDPSVKVIPDYELSSATYCDSMESYNSKRMQFIWKHWFEMLEKYKDRPEGLDIFSDTASDVKLNFIKEILEADVINLHWIAGMVNYDDLPKWFKGKKIVWTLHDMNAFTGGCHYSSGCNKYFSSCEACPQLGSTRMDDLANNIFNRKKTAYKNLELNIVTPSKWLGKEAEHSSLLSKFPIEVIPYGLPLDIYKPLKKSAAKKMANIEENKKVILYGAESLQNKRKGLKHLLEALDLLNKKNLNDVLVLTFGSGINPFPEKSYYQYKNLGPISDQKILSAIYSIADVFVIPSLEDNLPNTVLESLASGTPIVAYNVGGIPDMISHLKTGYIAKSRDVNDLANGIYWALTINNYDDISNLCRKTAEENYGLNVQAYKYLNKYKYLMNKDVEEFSNNKKLDLAKNDYLKYLEKESNYKRIFEEKNEPGFLLSQNNMGQNNFNFTRLKYSLKSELEYFKKNKYDIALLGQEIDPQNCDLKVCQDPKYDDFILATSLNPNGGSNQFKAYQSWVDSSFKVVSFNCHEEIKILKPCYPNVTFYPLGRTAYSKTGKYLVYFDDILKGLKEFPNQHYGLINSDIILNTQLINKEIFKNKLKENLQKGILYSNRIDIKEPENIEGEEYKVGFDLFFFSKNHVEKINGLDLIIGLPWWDYYFLLTAVFNSIEIIKINEKIAFHIKHTPFYEENMWYELGGTVLDYLNKMMKSAGINVKANNGTTEKTANIFKLSHVCLELIKNKSQIFPTDSGVDKKAKVNLYRKNEDSTLTDKFLVSAIVSTYNSEKFITACLDDLINQTLYSKGELEIVVVNSGSLQNEESVIEEYQSRYKNIKYIKTERETIYSAWNRGAKQASGIYITNANTDDRHSPFAFEKMANFLDKNQNKNIDVVYADSYVTKFENENWGTKKIKGIFKWPEHNIRHLFDVCYLGPQPMWRKRLHDKLGYFDSGYQSAGDYEFWLRLSTKGINFAHLNEVLGIYYENENSVSLSNINLNWEESEKARNENWPKDWGARPKTNWKSYEIPIKDNCFEHQNTGKVLLLCDYFWPSIGGVEVFIEELGIQLQKEGYLIEVACRRLDDRHDYKHSGMIIHEFNILKSSLNTELKDEIKKCRELILNGNYKSVIVLSQPDNWIGKVIHDLPVNRPQIIMLPSISANNLIEWADNGFGVNINNILKSADRIVTVSENGYDKTFLDKINIPNIFIPHSVEKDVADIDFRNEYGLDRSLPLLVMVANFWPVKNHDSLLEILSHNNGEWQIVIIGKKIDSEKLFYDKVSKLAERDKRVRVLGALERNIAAAAIRDADILLVPSKAESAGPLVILQAMSFGTPWIATPSCNAVKDEAGGLIVPVDEFPKAIESIINNKEIRNELTFLGKKHWEQSFRWNKSLPLFISLIEGQEPVSNLNMSEDLRKQTRLIQEEYSKSIPSMANKNEKIFSVIIPTYNRAAVLEKCLSALCNQNFAADMFEVIVCDDGSSDTTTELIKKIEVPYRLIYLRQENKGPAAARNMGIRKSTGKYLLILNDDAILNFDALKIHYDMQVKHLGEKISVLGAFNLLPEYTRSLLGYFVNTTDSLFNYPKMISGLLYNYEHFYTCNISILKAAAVSADLFNETFNGPAAEDIEFGYRLEQAGYRVLYEDSCIAWHDHQITLETFCKTHQVRGYGAATLSYIQPSAYPLEYLDRNSYSEWLKTMEDAEPKIKELYSAVQEIEKKGGKTDLQKNAVDLLSSIKLLQNYYVKKGILTNPYLSKIISRNSSKNNLVKAPFVSVIIPCFNYGKFLAEAVESVINQTFKDFEIIIVNDGSNDNSKEVAEDLVNKYRNDLQIRLINQLNSGQPAITRNNGIKEAKGDYILCLDADDKIAPTMLEKSMSVLEAFPDLGVAYTHRQDFDGSGQLVKASEYNFELLKRQNILSVCSLFRKKVWEEVGGYRTNVKGLEDWDFWIALGAKGYFGKLIPEPLFFYRRHDTGVFQEALKGEKEKFAQIILNNKSVYSSEDVEAAERFLQMTKKQGIDFSVIIPTFNRKDKLKKSIESVLGSSYSNFEIVIVNDAGDDVKDVVKNFNDSRIKYFEHETNKGLAASRNTGIKEAKGKFIALLDDDDIFYPDHLKIALENLNKHNRVVYTDALRTTYKKENGSYKLVDKSIPYSIDYNRNKLLIGNIAPVNCFVFEKTLVEKSGLFDESLPVLEDWDFWLRLSSLTEFKHIKESTVQVNWYVDGSTMTSSKGKDFEVARNKIYKKFENEIQKITNKNEIIEEFNSIWRNDFKTKSPTVSIIALSYNQIKYTKEFIQSVFEFTTIPFELIIIDNNSDSETVEYLKEIDKSKENTRVIFNQKNFGFPKGINQAIKEARGKYLLIANNDIVVTKGWFERIAEVAESDNKIGIVGPISNYVSGMQFDKNARYSNLKQMHEYVVNIRVKNLGKTLHFPRITFLCALIKREVIEKIGGLDERFSPGNFEDDDFCLRAQIAGFKTVIAQDVFIHHYGSKSFTAEGMEKYKTRLEINQKIFINKWGATPEEIWLKGKQIKGRKIMFTLNKNEFKENLERALSLIEEKDYDVALDYLNNSVEVYNNFDHDEHDPDLANLLNLAGNVSFLNGNPEAAQKYFENALNEDSSSSHACTGLGDVLFVSKNYESAKTMYQWGVKNNSENKAAKDGLVKVNKILNLQANDNSLSRLKEEINIPVKLNEEINIPESVYENKEPEENKLINEAYEMFNEKKFESALNKLKKAESLFNGQLTKPKDPEFASSFYNFKGFNYLGLNDIVNAKNCFQKALEINPDSSQAIAGLGEVLFLSKFDEEAKLMFEKAVNKNPNNLFAIGGLKKVNKLLNFDEDHSSLTQRLNSEDKLKIYHRDDIGKLCNKLQLLGKGAEVGVQAGEYSRTIRSTWEGEELYLIDWWRYSPNYKDIANAPDEKQKELYLSVVKKFMDDHSVHIIRKESIEASKQFSDEYFDWIYLDADHSYEGCLNDLKAWYPKLKKGGIFAGHDYFDGTFTGGIFGVKSAVDSFISDKEVNLYTTEENTVRSWYFIKPGSNLPETVLKSNDDNEGQINSDLQKLQMVLNEILESSFELFGLKHFDEAIDALNRSEDIFYSQNNKELISAFENMKGFNYLGINDKVRARECFETALNINAESSQACAGLGELFYLDGKDNEAKTMYEFAVKNNPDNQYAVTGLVKVNKILNLPDMHNTVLQ